MRLVAQCYALRPDAQPRIAKRREFWPLTLVGLMSAKLDVEKQSYFDDILPFPMFDGGLSRR